MIGVSCAIQENEFIHSIFIPRRPGEIQSSKMAASDQMAVVDTERRMQSLTRSADVREDMALVMAPHSNWEEYLMPAPLSIALLGKYKVQGPATNWNSSPIWWTNSHGFQWQFVCFSGLQEKC